ncbi:MAG TPA: linear amide C-N hydrolase [Tenuifilaceae bacterium]|nr:linear amide C-N hydrolase [Tenuifilaceae bacterium]HPQ34336.1 linear amide C-N hydrolase [Tenuifilaceae bacterium]HRX68900.1 linear amide C-N hydrolase [Tenuifilaceae bacterium]
MKTIFCYLIILIITVGYSNACTTFCLKNGESVILAKNLDWEIDLGFVMVNPSGIQKESFSDEGKSIIWTSKYPSVTFNQFGKEFPLGGMNFCGLAMEELNSESVIFINDSSKNQLNEFQLVQYILDNCSNVNEAIQLLKILQQKVAIQTLHYMIADSSGVSAVIEFDGTKFNPIICDGHNYSVLSNNMYHQSLRYLNNFEGFGGKLPIVNRSGSNERFVFTVKMLSNFSNQNPVDYSFRVLDSVKQYDTRWSIVYDTKMLKIYFRFHSCEKVKEFDLSLLNIHSLKQTIGCDITRCSCIEAKHFSEISANDNSSLIKNVSDKIGTNYQYLLNKMADYGNLYLKKIH